MATNTRIAVVLLEQLVLALRPNASDACAGFRQTRGK